MEAVTDDLIASLQKGQSVMQLFFAKKETDRSQKRYNHSTVRWLFVSRVQNGGKSCAK